MAAGQGEGELQCMHRTQCRNRHVTEAASPRIGAAWVPKTSKADHVRPETGARCGKAARRDLRGGLRSNPPCRDPKRRDCCFAAFTREFASSRSNDALKHKKATLAP